MPKWARQDTTLHVVVKVYQTPRFGLTLKNVPALISRVASGKRLDQEI
jgi:hypothetical protein